MWLMTHNVVKLHSTAEYRELLLDRGSELCQVVTDLVTAQLGEAVEAKFEYCLNLRFGQAISAAFLVGGRLDRFDEADIGRDVADRPFLGEQPRARIRRVRRAADHGDHLVEV